MPNLYITEQGAVLRKTGDRLIVEKEGELLLEVPCHQIDTVLIFGNVQVTTQALNELFEHGIELALLTQEGRLKGQLTPMKAKNIELRMAQYRRYHEEDFSLDLAKAVLKGKIRNGLQVIRNFRYNHPEIPFEEETTRLEWLLKEIDCQPAFEPLLGLEGTAARYYFQGLAKMCLKELKFERRLKRPAPDPVNALLSFGYTLVVNELSSLTDAMGFDPYIGFFHKIEYGRPSLACDLLEEFRAPLVDRLTLYLINRKILGPKEFYKDEESGSMYLKREGMKIYFREYEKFLNDTFTHPRSGEQTSFRRCFRLQAEAMARTITQGVPYIPFEL